jgi:hypothetical protein
MRGNTVRRTPGDVGEGRRRAANLQAKHPILLGVVTFTLGILTGCDFGIPALEQPAPQHECFSLQDPYAVPGAFWHRANFHMHSSHSDGALRSDQLVDLYGRYGYTVICISDHNQYGDQDGGVLPQYQLDDVLHDWNDDGVLHPEHVLGSGVEAYVRDYGSPAAAWSRDGYVRPQLSWADAPIVLSGAEMSLGGWHIGTVGMPAGALEPPGQTGYIGRTHAAGGFVFLAHPGEWNLYPDRLANVFDLGSMDAIEIMNGLRLVQQSAKSTPEGSGSGPDAGPPAVDPGGRDVCAAPFPPDATPLWDALLSRGFKLWGIANDDNHTWVGAAFAYPFTAFDMVLTADPTQEGFLHALHAGSYYMSTGLFFRDLGVRGTAVTAWVPGAQRLRFVGWGGETLLETDGERAAYVVTGMEGYVRVEAEGAPVNGHPWPARVWSQPFFLEAAPCAGGKQPVQDQRR